MRLYHRPLDQLEAVLLDGTEGGRQTFISPDGQRLVFYRIDTSTLLVVPIAGGPAVQLGECPSACRGGTWNGDTIVFGSTNDGLYRISDTGGGAAEQISALDVSANEISHLYPEFLPDGRSVLYTRWSGSLNTSQVAVLDIETQTSQILGPGSTPSYLASGHLVYAYAGSLWAAPFDLDSGSVAGAAELLVQGIQVNSGGLALYAVAGDGSLAYVPGDTQSGAVPGWLGESGWESLDVGIGDGYEQPRISPEGSRVALKITTGIEGESNIWIYEDGRGLDRISFGDADHGAVWSPNGQQIAFSSTGGLYRTAANGTGGAVAILEDTEALPFSWSGDDELIVAYEEETRGWNIGMIRIGQSDVIEPLLDTGFDEFAPALSPDGRWLAYVSNQSGREEIFVRPYPDVQSDRAKVSPTGGVSPVWTADSSDLFYRQGFSIMGVSFASLQDFGNAEVAHTGWYSEGSERQYDVAPDGNRFSMVSLNGLVPGQRQSQSVVFVENWIEEVKARVPVP